MDGEGNANSVVKLKKEKIDGKVYGICVLYVAEMMMTMAPIQMKYANRCTHKKCRGSLRNICKFICQDHFHPTATENMNTSSLKWHLHRASGA